MLHRTAILSPIIATIIFAAGCVFISEENFAKKSSQTLCERSEECDRAGFENAFTSQEDCNARLVDTIEPIFDCYDVSGCSFNDHRAKDCIEALNTASCSDYADELGSADCDDIYSCSNAGWERAAVCLAEL